MNKVRATLGATALVLTAAACGGPTTSTVHGTVSPTGPSSALGLGGDQQSYSDCSTDTPKPGDQVTVTDPNGKVIGNATLGPWLHQTVRAGGLKLNTCVMPFIMRQVLAEQRYGFKINNVPGTIWVNNVSHRVALEVSSAS